MDFLGLEEKFSKITSLNKKRDCTNLCLYSPFHTKHTCTLHWQILLIGSGSVSIVAVKTLKENATDKERADLIAELQIMKMLEPHPNVVKLLGCCTEKEPIFLIMEFVSKGKLQSYLRSSRAERYYNNMHGQSKTLTSRDLTSFVYQVAKGMEFLSAKGVREVHRSLLRATKLFVVL